MPERTADIEEKSPWILYADQKPLNVGVYQWRVPSVAVPGLIVTFYARMRERGAGFVQTISPAFDHWDGYQVIVPTGTEWREVKNPLVLARHECAAIQPEGVSLVPCPFCGKVPTWQALEASSSGGVFVDCSPHRYNKWWLECCEWSRTPRFHDPRELASHRNGLLIAALSPNKEA